MENKVLDETIQGQPLVLEDGNVGNKKLFLESYGCAMNFFDSVIIASILSKNGFSITDKVEVAKIIFVIIYDICHKDEQPYLQWIKVFKQLKRKISNILIRISGRQALSWIALFNSMPVNVANLSASTYTMRCNMGDNDAK